MFPVEPGGSILTSSDCVLRISLGRGYFYVYHVSSIEKAQEYFFPIISVSFISQQNWKDGMITYISLK